MERSNRVARPGVQRRIAGRTIAVVGAVTTALGGCSFAMQGPDPSWDGQQKPDCSESYAPVMIDGLMGSALASSAIQLATQDTIAAPAEASIALLGIALIYSASAVSGARKYNACRTVTATWRAREAIRERDEGAARSGAAPASPAPGGAAAAQLRVAVATPAYFCVRSPSRPVLEICMRDRGRCEHARDLMGLPGSEGCAPHDAAWCFGASTTERCFATPGACEAQRTQARGGASECSVRR